MEELRNASANGVLIINTTQCCHGSVSAIYETGKVLLEAGVISGADMTPEAALTKLSYVLGKDEWDLETKRQVNDSIHSILVIVESIRVLFDVNVVAFSGYLYQVNCWVMELAPHLAFYLLQLIQCSN